ncbi:MAG: hypothetical protein KKB25_00160 [Nanoarchaeota archaeon]|nr:hypothetical protein [Nanoarchaeota archaeon]
MIMVEEKSTAKRILNVYAITQMLNSNVSDGGQTIETIGKYNKKTDNRMYD